ncbi:E3 ubiquitin-protein ligase TRIM35-like [Mixophyes fleayi]|uniref:E3 ubiquitin-protein ligase TRIM35-like n=1 Tax=Mixophyes fleayi TaxID=3061075 RepID=UPI003F4D907B
MASADLSDELNCSICLSIYTDPVNLNCGHNFCRVCINRVLDTQRGSGVYTCPECRSKYKRRPVLQRNIALCNIAERCLSSQPKQEETRIFLHSKSEEHVLSDPTTSLGNRKCSVHKKVLEYYCAKDAACICVSCKRDGKYRGHQVEPIYNASNKKKEKLRKILGQLISKREETEKNVQRHQKNRKKAEDKAAGITGRVTAVFREIQEKLQTLEAQILDDITREVKQNTTPISDLIQQLEIKRDELCSKICHIEKLCNMTDPVTVLQEQESGRGDFCNVEKGDHKAAPAIDEVNEILLSLNLHKGLADIVDSVKSQFPENPNFQLDKDTAASNVVVSTDLKIAYGTETNDDIDDTDERFDAHQVLSTPIIHLHTFNTAFTEPLYAAIRVGLGVWVRIIN